MSYCTTLTDLCQHLFQLLSVVFLHQLNILNITHIGAVVKSLLKERIPASGWGLKRRCWSSAVKDYQREDVELYSVWIITNKIP